METQLKERLGWAREAIGHYTWNFKIPDNNTRLKDTIKRKLYKKLVVHPELYRVHRNGSISIICNAEAAPKAIAHIDGIIQGCLTKYSPKGVFIEETNKLHVI
jgi:hypothetical protein